MTENEKLRKLLAEARETLRDFEENWDCDSDSHKYRTTCRACAAKAAKQRIDTALAEPPLESAAEVRKRLWPHSVTGQEPTDSLDEIEELRRERDEARFELRRAQDYAAGPSWDTHRESVAAAHRRGAEAMREMAAQTAYDMRGVPDDTGRKIEAAIHALPTPEDKS